MTDCYSFPHQESVVDGKISVSLDVQMSQAMYSFHRRINKNEQVVGWFATTVGSEGAQITEYSTLINQFYNGQCAHPVHVVVDTALTSDTMTPRGYICRTTTVDGNETSAFEEITVDVEFSAGEKVGLSAMLRNHKHSFPSSTVVSALPSESQALQSAVKKLHTLLDEIQVRCYLYIS